jgi:DNA-binding NarL/FixJ family response regulator
VARGYLLKDSVEAALLKAIRATYARHTFSASRIARMLLEGDARGLDAHAAEHRYALLTVRERGNKDIAQLLSLRLHTVETHRVRIMERCMYRASRSSC